METRDLRGNLAAIEYLLGQLFVYAIDTNPDPQAWIRANIDDVNAKLCLREKFSDDERYAAEQTFFRVMQMTSNVYEALGSGKAIEG